MRIPDFPFFRGVVASNWRRVFSAFLEKVYSYQKPVLFVASSGVFSFGLIHPAAALELKTNYSISVGSFSVGQVNMTTKILPGQYHIKAGLNLVGLAELFADVKAATAANGEIVNDRVYPAHFFSKAKSGRDERTIRMTMKRGNVANITIVPPLVLRDHNIPLEKHHERSVYDPLSALIMPVAAGKDMLIPENCNRTLPVFDGGTRMSINLKYKETKEFKKGYQGKVLVCSVQYTPIAGYQPSEKIAAHLQKSQKMTVWLAPIDNTRFLVPVRANVDTPAGSVVFEATNWSLSTDIAQK